jgi:hypothetical protein
MNPSELNLDESCFGRAEGHVGLKKCTRGPPDHLMVVDVQAHNVQIKPQEGHVHIACMVTRVTPKDVTSDHTK